MKKRFRRLVALVLSAAMVCQFAPITAKASAGKITPAKITAKSANGHDAGYSVDGNKETYWQSIPSDGEGNNTQKAYSSMYAHNHYIDITLDGTYDISEIRVFNQVDGSYNNYYVYASLDGENYTKIVSKTSNDAATAEGDSFTVNTEASYLRLNMAYNSDRYVTNLAEIEIYGTKKNDTVAAPKEINVENWQGSQWQIEWDKFESDSAYAEQKVIAEMGNLVGRVLGEAWKDSFVFEMRGSLTDEKDIFEIKDWADGKIVIRGNNGIAMASGFNHYLKYYLKLDYNPLYGSHVDMTGKTIVPVGKKIVKEAQFDLRYALNFCTYSYTMAFWNWDEYEEFLDWAAMNGLNLILDIVGQEEVLRQTLKEYHFSDEEIKDYICGPAYFAWFYMQNLYSVGGPLPNSWFEQRVELGRKIHDRMQTYGIHPVIQGFAGQVPETFVAKNEGAVITPVDGWPGHTRPSLLKPYLTKEDIANGKRDYFPEVAQTFYEKQKNVFGDVSDYYATDPFHEGGNTGGLEIATIFKAVQDEMLKSNANAKWVMQQWQGNLDWTKMSKMDVSKAIALDLQADMNPQHGLFENNGTPWIYCMLHNFGGRMGLDGEVPVVGKDPVVTYNNTNHMTGIGITPEAMENSPVVYELFLETNWSKDPIEYNEWMKAYAERRAGGTSESLQEAWDILVDTAYADKSFYCQGAAETVINARPGDSFGSASTWGHSTIAYDKSKLDQALKLLVDNYDAFSASEAFKYDLADVAEQVLCNAAVEYHALMVQAKNAGNLEEFKKYSDTFLEIITLSDQILSATDEFMLGTWIEAARKMITGADDWTKDLFEFNARLLVTTWGGEKPAGSGGLKDYSNRKWAGLTSSFYKERWAIWIRNRIAELEGTAKDPADAKAEGNWFLWEFQWANRKSDDENGKYAFATVPSSDNLGALALQAYNDYSYTKLQETGAAAAEKVNLLKGKTFTLTSGSTSSGDLANITDGKTSTEWAGTGTVVHVLEVDLEGSYVIDEMLLSVQQLAKNFPYQYKVETYHPETGVWETAAEYTDRKMGSNVAITLETPVQASKIRLTMDTNDAVNSPLTITQVEAYGKKLSGGESEEILVNLAAGITPELIKGKGALDASNDYPVEKLTAIAGSSYPGEDNEGPAGKILDDDESTHWHTNYNTPEGQDVNYRWVGVQLEEVAPVYGIRVKPRTSGGKNGAVTEYKVQYRTATDGEWIDAAGGTWDKDNTDWKIVEFDSAVEAKQVRIVGVHTWADSGDDAHMSMAEFRILGSANRNDMGTLTDGNTSAIWNYGANNYPVDVALDLSANQNAGYVDYVETYFESAGRPYKFYIYVINMDGTKEIVSDYRENAEALQYASYKATVGKRIKAAGVCLVGNNGQGSYPLSWPAITEIEVMGKPVEYVNVAKDIIPQLTHGVSEGGKSLSSITDGDTSSLWVADGNRGYPVEVQLDLNAVTDVSYVDLYFEKTGLPFQFYVKVIDKNDAETTVLDLSQNAEALSSEHFKIPVNKEIKSVVVRLTGNNGKGAYTGAWPAIAELMVMGAKMQEEAAVDFTEGKISGVTVSGGNATNNVLDGDLTGSWDVVNKDEDIVFDLGGAHYVKKVDLTFEKGELGLNYMVYAEDDQGNRTVVCDKSKTKELLGTATITVNVERIANKIIFVHKGNNGNGPAYLAERRLYEAEVYGGKPVSISGGASVSPEGAGVLTDNNAETTYTTVVNTPVTVELGKSVDVNMVSVQAAADETEALSYTIEYYDEDTKDWKAFEAASTVNSEGDLYTIGKETVFTKKLRFTFAADMILAEIKAYKVDSTQPLLDRISEIETILAGLSYNGQNGSYTETAKATLEAVLAEANAAVNAGIASKEVTAWTNSLNKALDTFYKTGIVYVNRDALLVALSEVNAMFDELKEAHFTAEKTALEAAYTSAMGEYHTYSKTQAELDAAQQALQEKTSEINVRKVVKDTLRVEIKEAEKAALLYGGTAGDALKQQIETAKQSLASGDAIGTIQTGKNALKQVAMNLVVIPQANEENLTYTITVENGTVLNADDIKKAGGTITQEASKTIVSGVKYNCKIQVTANTVEGQKFAGWEVLGEIFTTNAEYTFYVPNSMTIKATYTEEEIKAANAANLTNIKVTDNEADVNRADIKFVAQLNKAEGFELVEAGLLFSVNATPKFVAEDGTPSTAEGVRRVPAKTVNTSYQFSMTLRGAPKQEGYYVYATVYAQFYNEDTKETQWVYSAPRKVTTVSASAR